MCLPDGLDTASGDLTTQQGLHPITVPAVCVYVLHFKRAKFEQGPLRFIISNSSSLYKDMHHLVQKHSSNIVVTGQCIYFPQKVKETCIKY